MPFIRPTLPELIDRTNSDIASRVTGDTAVLRRSALGILAREMAGASHMLHGHLDWISRQVMIDTADEEHLLRHASIWGLTRVPAAPASGLLNFAGSNGSVVPAGTVVQRSDGVQFATADDGIIVAGTAQIAVQAIIAGMVGNTDGGISVSLLSPVPGVQSVASVAAAGIRNGVDEESDDSLRDRLLARVRQPPHGGAKFDYVMWALEVPGVTRAWVYPQQLGIGTVSVTFVRDNDVSIFPDADAVADVQAYIDSKRPVTAELFVFAAEEYPVDITLSVTPNTAAVRAAVEAEYRDLFIRTGVPGGIIPLSHIREATSIAAGEYDHNIISPISDIEPGQNQLPTLGVITWV